MAKVCLRRRNEFLEHCYPIEVPHSKRMRVAVVGEREAKERAKRVYRYAIQYGMQYGMQRSKSPIKVYLSPNRLFRRVAIACWGLLY